MRKLIVVTLATIASMVTVSAPSLAAHSETYRYIAPGGDAFAFNCDGALKALEPGIGGLCFDVLRGDTTVTITINDDSGVPVAGQLRFRDPANAKIGDDQPFCGTTGSLAIPTNADEILVWTFTAKALPAACNPATQGTMTGVFA